MSFNTVKIKIAKKEGISQKEAAAELASTTRKAVANGAAKKNPNLLKVRGKAKK